MGHATSGGGGGVHLRTGLNAHSGQVYAQADVGVLRDKRAVGALDLGDAAPVGAAADVHLCHLHDVPAPQPHAQTLLSDARALHPDGHLAVGWDGEAPLGADARLGQHWECAGKDDALLLRSLCMHGVHDDDHIWAPIGTQRTQDWRGPLTFWSPVIVLGEVQTWEKGCAPVGTASIKQAVAATVEGSDR